MTREEIIKIPAGKEMNALIAEKVMGLQVVSMNHPCGFQPDSCNYEAAHFLPAGTWFKDEYPVYIPEYGIYPPIDDETEEGITYCIVEPVPFYSTYILPAWEVVNYLRSQKIKLILFENQSGNEYNNYYVYFGLHHPLGQEPWYVAGDTAPLAICRAALLTVYEGVLR